MTRVTGQIARSGTFDKNIYSAPFQHWRLVGLLVERWPRSLTNFEMCSKNNCILYLFCEFLLLLVNMATLSEQHKTYNLSALQKGTQTKAKNSFRGLPATIFITAHRYTQQKVDYLHYFILCYSIRNEGDNHYFQQTKLAWHLFINLFKEEEEKRNKNHQHQKYLYIAIHVFTSAT